MSRSSIAAFICLVALYAAAALMPMPRGNDPVFEREVLSYETRSDGTVAYDYIGEPLPALLDPREDPTLRTESSFTNYLGVNEAREKTYELVAYSDRAFVERDGAWLARETGYTDEATFASARRANPLASLFWERAYADTVYAGAGDGHILYTAGLWGTVRSAATGSAAAPTASSATVRTDFDGLTYEIYRIFLPFDTSVIPAGASISAASLNVYVTSTSNGDNDGTDFITVVNQIQNAVTTLTTADFDAISLGGTEGIDSGERKDITSISSSAYLSFALNSAGIGWISDAGQGRSCRNLGFLQTCLGLLEGHDQNNNSPGGTNDITISTSEQTGTSQDPYLSVTYSLGGSSLSRPPNNLGLVGYWSFNDGTGTTATDFSGNGRHGTLSGNGTTWVQGKRGTAVDLAGTNDNVNVGALSALDGVQKVTISGWVYDRAQTANASLVSRYTAGDPSIAYFVGTTGAGNNDDIAFNPDGGSGAYTTTNQHQANRWEHWVVVYDGTQANANRVTFYLNGVAQTATTQGTIATALDTSANVVRLGADSDEAEDFTGAFDDVRIYNRALSATEVAALYGVGTGAGGAVRLGASSRTLTNGTTLGQDGGLVGLWTFDGGDVNWTSGTAAVAYDRSGTGANGTLTNMERGVDAAPGKLGQALNFDETNNFVSIADNAAHNFGTTEDFSIAFWTRVRAIGGAYAGLVGRKLSRATVRPGYLVAFEGNGISAYIDDGADSATAFSASTINDDAWHHVVVTANRSGNATIYIDGAVNGTPVSLAAIGDLDDPGIPLTIGDIGFEGQPFDGYIDDVRIYSRVLSASEILQLYRLGQVRITQ